MNGSQIDLTTGPLFCLTHYRLKCRLYLSLRKLWIENKNNLLIYHKTNVDTIAF